MARNVIERIFGVLKHRFRILILSPRYNLQVQAQIPAALCTIHNFICYHDPGEGPLQDETDSTGAGSDDDDDPADTSTADAPPGDVHGANQMSVMRNSIASAMWDQYQQVVSGQHGELTDDEDPEIDDLLLGLDDIELDSSDEDMDMDNTGV
jgi:hypothetical protein